MRSHVVMEQKPHRLSPGSSPLSPCTHLISSRLPSRPGAVPAGTSLISLEVQTSSFAWRRSTRCFPLSQRTSSRNFGCFSSWCCQFLRQCTSYPLPPSRSIGESHRAHRHTSFILASGGSQRGRHGGSRSCPLQSRTSDSRRTLLTRMPPSSSAHPRAGDTMRRSAPRSSGRAWASVSTRAGRGRFASHRRGYGARDTGERRAASMSGIARSIVAPAGSCQTAGQVPPDICYLVVSVFFVASLVLSVPAQGKVEGGIGALAGPFAELARCVGVPAVRLRSAIPEELIPGTLRARPHSVAPPPPFGSVPSPHRCQIQAAATPVCAFWLLAYPTLSNQSLGRRRFAASSPRVVASIGRTLPVSADGLMETAPIHMKLHTLMSAAEYHHERVAHFRSVGFPSRLFASHLLALQQCNSNSFVRSLPDGYGYERSPPGGRFSSHSRRHLRKPRPSVGVRRVRGHHGPHGPRGRRQARRPSCTGRPGSLRGAKAGRRPGRAL